MKPRRWYSSSEINPTLRPRVAPFASLIQLAYAERTYHKQGSIIRIEPTEPLRVVRENDSQAPAASVIMRRIDAA